jgi:hypothetical protein
VASTGKLRELGERRVTANTVSPGADIAAVVAFLAGPDGGWITGQNLRAGGGIV